MVDDPSGEQATADAIKSIVNMVDSVIEYRIENGNISGSQG